MCGIPFRSTPPTPHPLPQHRKINCSLQNAVAKFAWWAAMWPQLKVRLRCKACHAEECAAFRSTSHNSASAAPQNQLHLAECTRRKKKLHGGLRLQLRIRSAAKSIAFSQFALAEKFAEKFAVVCCDVLRYVGYSTHSNFATSLPRRNSTSAAPQNQANCSRQKICMVGCEVICGVCA
jgi:hypothetical protein